MQARRVIISGRNAQNISPFTTLTIYKSMQHKQHGDGLFGAISNAIRPGFNLLRDVSLGKTVGAKGSSKMTFSLMMMFICQ